MISDLLIAGKAVATPPVVSIDPSTCECIEDAFHVRRHEDGSWTVTVCLPDATNMPRSEYDLEGYQGPRVASTKTGKSHGLDEAESRPVLFVEILVTAGLAGTVRSMRRTRGRLHRRLTIVEADRIVRDEEDPLHGPLRTAMSLGVAIRRSRREEAGVDAGTPDVMASGEIVNEMMVLANGALAALCRERCIPVLYLNQPDGASTPQTHPTSTYSIVPLPHPGLGMQAYAKFTSPIRRGVDMANQHALIEGLAPRLLERIGSRINALRQTSRRHREDVRRGIDVRIAAAFAGADERRLDEELERLSADPAADRKEALHYVAARMAADDLRRSELVALHQRALAVLGPEPHRVVQSWIHKSPVRLHMLHDPATVPTPDTMTTPANDLRLRRLAAANEASCRLHDAVVSGHPSEILYSTVATWRSASSNHEVHGIARTLKGSRSEALRLMLARLAAERTSNAA